MENIQDYYVLKLKDKLNTYQRQDPHYSLRTFAKELNLHPATLSQVLKGSRTLPLKDSETVMNKLALSPQEKLLFIESLRRSKKITSPDFSMSPHEIKENLAANLQADILFKIETQWEYQAVLGLAQSKSFSPQISFISDRLRLTDEKAKEVLKNLLLVGFIKPQGSSLDEVEQRERKKLRQKDMLIMTQRNFDQFIGENNIFETEIELNTVDNQKKLETLFNHWIDQVKKTLTSNSDEEVFQVSLQLVKLTKNDTANREKNYPVQ
jgi:hypothetical protein